MENLTHLLNVLREDIKDAEFKYIAASTTREEIFWDKKLQTLNKERSDLIKRLQAPQSVSKDREVWDALLTPLRKEDMCTTLDTASLSKILSEPLNCKIPALRDPKLVEEYPEIFEESTDECAWQAYTLYSGFCRSHTWAGSGEVISSSFYNYFVGELVAVLKDTYGLPVSLVGNKEEDPSISISTDKSRRDIEVCDNSVPLLIGEHKDQSLKEALKDVGNKHLGSSPCVYGDLEYIFAYAADGNTVHLLVLPLSGADAIVIKRRLNMDDKKDRQDFVIAMTNILRWIRTIHNEEILCKTGLCFKKDHYRDSPWKLLDPDSSGKVIINIGINHVRKEFQIPPWAYEDFKSLYCHLHKGVRNAVCADVYVDGKELFEPIVKKPRRTRNAHSSHQWLKVELHLLPVGSQVDIHLETNLVVQMVRDVLGCLKQLHGLGFCHYDIRIPNVIQFKKSFLLCDFEMAGRTHCSVPKCFYSQSWKPGCKLTYDPSNDLYMVGKNLILGCKNSPDFLTKLAGVLMSGKVASAEEALQELDHYMS